MPAEAVVSALDTSADSGLSTVEAGRRRAAVGANALRDHSARPLATQTLVVFAVRTRRVPFLRSRPSWPRASAPLVVVAIGVVLPTGRPG